MRIRLWHNTYRILRAVGAVPDLVLGEVDRAIGLGAIMLARTAKQEAPKSFSTLTNSIQARRVSLAHHRVLAGVAYAVDVEEGRKPGKKAPPIDALRRWIRTRRMKPIAARDARGLAFLIARKIARDGTEPNPFMQRSLDRSQGRFEAMVSLARDRGLARTGL